MLHRPIGDWPWRQP